MNIRRRPGILFLYVGVLFLALGSLLRQTVLPPMAYEFQLVSAGALVATVLTTYLLYLPGELPSEPEIDDG